MQVSMYTPSLSKSKGEDKGYCASCTSHCPERRVVIEYQQTHDIPTRNHKYHRMRFATITTNAIPHMFS